MTCLHLDIASVKVIETSPIVTSEPRSVSRPPTTAQSHYTTDLPGHGCVSQLRDSVAGPSPLQSFPPFTGGGLVQERERR